MAKQDDESTPRERLARIFTLLSRVRMYWRSALAMAIAGMALSLVLALHAKRAWRSETTVVYREAITTGRDGENMSARAARLGPKLKDFLAARSRLTTIVEEFDLYPEQQKKSMLHALEELQNNISFKARASDTYVISFVHEDPHVAQKVTARLAALMIADYSRDTIDTAVMTRDFLKRELDEADKGVDDASRALATFLAAHPQFQWGLNDNPYATVPGAVPGIPAMADPRNARPAVPARPLDPELASLEARLARVEGRGTPKPIAAPAAPGSPAPVIALAEAEKKREAAAAALVAAQATLAEKLGSLTPVHPDAVTAKSRAEAAQQALIAADANLRRAQEAAHVPGPVGPDPYDGEPRSPEVERERLALIRQIAARRAELGAPGDRHTAADKADKADKASKQAVKNVVELETEWHRLKMDLERVRDRLRAVQVNARTAQMSADAAERKTQAEMVVLDPAYLPTQPDRGRGRVFFIGLIITLFLSLGISGSRVLMNDTIYDAGDVEAAGAPELLVALPHMPAAEIASRAVRKTLVPEPDSPVPARTGAAPYFWNDVGVARARSGRAVAGWPESETAPSDASGWNEPSVPTLRFGGMAQRLLSNGNGAHGSDARFESALAHVPRAGSSSDLVAAPPYGLMDAVLDEPEVEVIGADTGDGVLTLLRAVPPEALAALRVLRHRLDQKRGDGHFVVSVVSPGSGEGKTSLAVRLALILSEAERARVVLVDGNLERPCVAEALGVRLPEGMGLSSQLRARMMGRSRPLGVVRLTPSLTLLAEPGPESSFPAALHSTHFDSALRALQRNYDYVVVDGPGILGSGDANVIEDASDGVLLVARASVTEGVRLCRAATQLGDRRILGVVLNDAPSVGAKDRQASRVKPPRGQRGRRGA